MSVVIDASVVVAATVDAGPNGIWAEDILDSGALAAPLLLPVEATNILRRLERAGQLTASEADIARQDVLRLQVEQLPFEPFAERIWELRENFTSYDAWYVAVAEALDAPLATLDRRLSRAPGSGCRILLPS